MKTTINYSDFDTDYQEEKEEKRGEEDDESGYKVTYKDVTEKHSLHEGHDVNFRLIERNIAHVISEDIEG